MPPVFFLGLVVWDANLEGSTTNNFRIQNNTEVSSVMVRMAWAMHHCSVVAIGAEVLITAFNNYCWQSCGATSLLLYEGKTKTLTNTKIDGICWDINGIKVHFLIIACFFFSLSTTHIPICPRLQKAKCWLKHSPWLLAVPSSSHFDSPQNGGHLERRTYQE